MNEKLHLATVTTCTSQPQYITKLVKYLNLFNIHFKVIEWQFGVNFFFKRNTTFLTKYCDLHDIIFLQISNKQRGSFPEVCNLKCHLCYLSLY